MTWLCPGSARLLIPAHAGVIPKKSLPDLSGWSYPRARGGDPDSIQKGRPGAGLSPRTRG